MKLIYAGIIGGLFQIWLTVNYFIIRNILKEQKWLEKKIY